MAGILMRAPVLSWEHSIIGNAPPRWMSLPCLGEWLLLFCALLLTFLSYQIKIDYSVVRALLEYILMFS